MPTTAGSIVGSTASAYVLGVFGPRHAYLLALALFCAGSIGCAFAPSMPWLLAGRSLQGMGGGALFALSYALIRLIFEECLWPRAVTLVSVMCGISTLCGPAFGGMFAQSGHWRWAFWVLPPLAVVLGLLVSNQLPVRRDACVDRRKPAISRIALLVLSVCVVSLASIYGLRWNIWPGASIHDSPQRSHGSINNNGAPADMVNFLPLHDGDHEVLVDDDVAASLTGFEWRVLAGRVVGIADNQFVDLPEHALRHRQLLIDVAKFGDFCRGRSGRARRLAYTLDKLAAMAGIEHATDASAHIASCFAAVLPRLEELIDRPKQYEHLWFEAEQDFIASEVWLAHPETRIDEYAAFDLAVVRLPERVAATWKTLSYHQRYFGLSRISFHNRTRCATLAIVHGRALEIAQRYEGWVERVCAVPRPRRDLAIFSAALQAAEQNPGTWRYDGVESIMPTLKYHAPAACSSLSVEAVVDELTRFLDVAPAAWSPVPGRIACPPGDTLSSDRRLLPSRPTS